MILVSLSVVPTAILARATEDDTGALVDHHGVALVLSLLQALKARAAVRTSCEVVFLVGNFHCIC